MNAAFRKRARCAPRTEARDAAVAFDFTRVQAPDMFTARLPWLTGVLSLASACLAADLSESSVHAFRDQITLPTYPWKAVKHPYFRGTDGRNIYPYAMLDFLSRDKTNRVYRTVVLENEYLRITFLPELGGKIHEVIDKTTDEPMFYVNNVIKPALIGQAGAWTSGGVEWNTGPQGHTVGCMQPVEVAILPKADDGSQSVAIGETERIYGTKWTVVVTLRPGRSFIEERIRIYNPTETIRPYYFWNCTAVPNTKGFRFIYPMTLGTDHGAEQFFKWPINEGKDLSCGTNYEDASSIFAWHCDQDFFGSYNEDLDRGVVAYANHHQLPGKKAWTWGHGSYGTMHQMDLTDDDGPYNEVQTGPLLTQGEVGRLDPCEAVEWKEWWYPVHAIGGFTFANKDVAVNAEREEARLKLRILGSGQWSRVSVTARTTDGRKTTSRCDISPARPVELTLAVGESEPPVSLLVATENEVLAEFKYPLELPARHPPEPGPEPDTASGLAQAGWQDFLFGRYREAESRFHKALQKDENCVEAHLGLAFVRLDPDPSAAAQSARNASLVSPLDGRAWYALAVAESRLSHNTEALDAAWQASLDPASAVAARALVAKLLIRQARWQPAVEALSAPGPWLRDPVCRNRLALALLNLGAPAPANPDLVADGLLNTLATDPLDALAIELLSGEWNDSKPAPRYDARSRGETTFALRTDIDDLGPAVAAWKPAAIPTASWLDQFPEWPGRYEDLAPLLERAGNNPSDGIATLRLGHLLFHLGRYEEGRAMWRKAAELGAEPVIAYRALGMAAKTLDDDLKSAREWLEKANQADPTDSIVARDLANVLFALADQSDQSDEKRALTIQAREALSASFDEGKGRSDFVALLARAHSRLGDHAATARLLDSVRITIWEGAREAHDLFEAAHLALGDEALAASKPREALAEFDRALEYPENLATGRLENTREAHIQYRRGNALSALGQKDQAIQAWRKAAGEAPSRDAKKEDARKLAAEALKTHP
ncbi:MAG: DUF5107 domain-containing protein [Verrucomicrobiales bacterium]|nr:DUF5107 domain-containing protein [Verrucomicrobiales bacterium]